MILLSGPVLTYLSGNILIDQCGLKCFYDIIIIYSANSLAHIYQTG